MSDFINQEYLIGPAIECYRSYPPDETTDPDVTHFAHYLADVLQRSGVERPISADPFIMLASLALDDLARGRDGFTSQPILNHPLATRDPDVYSKLYQALPELAEQGFSERFAAVVRLKLLQRGMLGQREAAKESTLDANEIITEPITNIAAARERIIEDSRQRVLAHDWQELGVRPQLAENATTFALSGAILLRQAPMRSPVNVLSAKIEEDIPTIAALSSDNRAQELQPGVWLALTDASISPDYATATRDLLYLQMIETVADYAGLNSEQAALHFARDVHGPMTRATTRLTEYLLQNPDKLRQL